MVEMELYRVWAEPLNDYIPYMAFRWLPRQGTGSEHFIEKVEMTLGRLKKGTDEETYEYFKFKNMNELYRALSGIGILIGVLARVRDESLSEVQSKSLEELKDGFLAGVGRFNRTIMERSEIPLPEVQDQDMQQGSGLGRKGILSYL